jgi:hypothetical protein
MPAVVAQPRLIQAPRAFAGRKLWKLGGHASSQGSVALPDAMLENLVGRPLKEVPATVQVSGQKCVVQSSDVEVALLGKPAADLSFFPT